MASMLHPQHSFDPSHNFVAGRPGGLVQVDQSETKMLIERPLRRWTAQGGIGFLVRGSFLDINGVFGRFNMFHVCSSTAYARDLLWPGDEDEVLVDHVDYDAFLSRFPTVEFDTDASDFDGGHRDNLPRRLSRSKSSFKVSSISAGLSSLFEPSHPPRQELWLYPQSNRDSYRE